MQALGVPFEDLTFVVRGDSGRSYTVGIRNLCAQPLNAGLLEQAYMKPEEWAKELQDMRQEELTAVSAFTQSVSRMWRRRDWTVLTPPPPYDVPEFQAPDRTFGWLCAAVLQSYDPFPVPYRGNGGDEPADYAEACVVYVARRSQGLLPEPVRALIRWEEIAKPRLV